MTQTSPFEALEAVLDEARRRSLIGKAPLATQVSHSEAFLRALRLEAFDGPVLELGAGGGLPGLVIATEDQDLRLMLLDSANRSVEFLNWAVDELDLSPRVTVIDARAEDLGRNEEFRGSFDAVIARSFAPPAVTAECAAPLLRVGGRLIVSEPPGYAQRAGSTGASSLPSAQRWPAEECGKLGLTPLLSVYDGFGFAILRQTVACPEHYPRRPGIPSKRPLFS